MKYLIIILIAILMISCEKEPLPMIGNITVTIVVVDVNTNERITDAIVTMTDTDNSFNYIGSTDINGELTRTLPNTCTLFVDVLNYSVVVYTPIFNITEHNKDYKYHVKVK